MATPADPAARPIAVFDSGVGGLSVLRHLQQQLPYENLIYLADQAHVPYGPRSPEEIRRFSEAAARFLLERLAAKALVVACNTASAAALNHLRTVFPDALIVGMEPAVKPGAIQTKSGRVGVLATVGTFESERYARLMTRFAHDVEVFEDPCQGLVELIEAGQLDGLLTRQLLTSVVEPMLDQGVDTLVLGCTHYPFVLPLLREIAGPSVTIIDPAPAVARQTVRVLAEAGRLNPGPAPGQVRGLTTAVTARLSTMAETLLGQPLPVTTIAWEGGQLSY